MSVLEKNIENRVVAWAINQKFLAPKVKFAEAGYPDRLFISPKGHTIFIEFKVPGEQPDRLQYYRIGQLRMRGIPAFWCDNYFSAINILKAALEPTSVSGESDTDDADSSSGGSILRPRFGQDVRSTSESSHSPKEEASNESLDHSTAEGSGTHLAERDEQVGGVRPSDVCSPAREPEGGESKA